VQYTPRACKFLFSWVSVFKWYMDVQLLEQRKRNSTAHASILNVQLSLAHNSHV